MSDSTHIYRGKVDENSNIVRNVLSEIMRECKNRNIHVSQNFLMYYIELCKLDPNRGIIEANITNREATQAFIKYVVTKLSDKNNTQMVTLKIQYFVSDYFQTVHKAVRDFRKSIESKLFPFLMCITEQDKTCTVKNLYKLISIYTILASGLGNPSEKNVFKEALQVVRSIVDEKEMKVFPSIPNYIRQELIKSLVDLTTGIRLYNKACKKGGQDIKDLPTILKKSIEIVTAQMESCLDKSAYRSRMLTKFIENHIRIRLLRDEYGVETVFSSPKEKIVWIEIKQLAVVYRQWTKSSRILLEEMKIVDQHRKEIVGEYNKVIKKLYSTVVPNFYMNVTHVFPYFVQLSQIWKDIQNTTVQVRELCKVYSSLMTKVYSLPFSIGETAIYKLEEWLVDNDQSLILDINPDIKVHIVTNKFTKKDLEFHGYCCWMLINAHGTLVPANIPLGLVEYKKKYYGFCSKIAANAFMQNPEQHIMRTILIARKHIELIAFLNMKELLQEHIDFKEWVEEEETEEITTIDEGQQTDTHFQESNIEPTYHWNVWHLRETLMKQERQFHMRTHYCLTDKMQKVSTSTQTWDTTNSETQTSADNYANTQRPVRFVYGLRGRRDGKIWDINLV